MADASDTSPYILASPDSTLPNSRNLVAAGGLVTQDTGAEGTFTVSTVGNLNNLSSYESPGFLVLDSTVSPVFVSRNINAGTGISVTNPGGQGADTVIAVVPDSTTQQVTVLDNAVFGSTRATLNLIGGGAVSVTIGDNSLDNRADITITSPLYAGETATYILQTPDSGLPNSQPLSLLATGLLKVTTGTGVLSHAVADTDYQAASTNLTSISAITPNNGSLIVGNGTGYSGFPSGGDPGDVFTSGGFGNLPSWQAPATGNLVEILPDATPSQALIGNTTYISQNSSGGKVLFTLPAIPTPGNFYQIIGVNQLGWQVNLNAGQTIVVGPATGTLNVASSTTGTGSPPTANDNIIIWCVNTTLFVGVVLSGTVSVT